MNKITRIIFLKAFILLISAFAISVKAADLEEQKNIWLSVRGELSDLEDKKSFKIEDIKKKNELLKEVYSTRNNFLKSLAVSYLDNSLQKQDLIDYFKLFSNDKNSNNHYSSLLLIESINRLKKSKIPEIKSFIKRYEDIYEKNTIPLFKITGSIIQSESPTEEKGGFHRGTRSVFMDISRTSSEEWLFILMHEMFHALDKELFKAVEIFSNEDLFKSVVKIGKMHTNLVELSSEEESLLDQWVLAGLNRNLFAEYRDWSFGFSVYEKGVKEGLWKRIMFVEQVLSYKGKNENMNAFVFRYLNERVREDDEGVLGRDIIKEKIKEKRDYFARSL